MIDVSEPMPLESADSKGVADPPNEDSCVILLSHCHKPRRNIGLNANEYSNLETETIFRNYIFLLLYETVQSELNLQ